MACKKVGRWITEKVRRPFEKFVERAEEKCSEARRWVEKEVREPIERRREKQEKRCKKRKCKKYCLCCNKWFCWIETIIEVVVEWVVKIVGEWLVETICKMVVRVIKVVVEVVISITKFIFTGFVCLFTEPFAALIALADLWNDLFDIYKDIIGLAVDLLKAIAELFDIIRDFLLKLARLLGPIVGLLLGLLLGGIFGGWIMALLWGLLGLIGRYWLGLLAGIFDLLRKLFQLYANLLKGIAEIFAGIMTLDFCRVFDGLVKYFGLGGFMNLLAFIFNFLGLGASGIRDLEVRRLLREKVLQIVKQNFDGDNLAMLEDRLNLYSINFGAKWKIVPYICTISTRSRMISLRELHKNKKVDLYEVAGYAPIGCSRVGRSVYKLVYKDTSRKVSLKDIRDYLKGDDRVPEFVLMAGSKENLQDMLKIAKRKFAEIAIYLDVKPIVYYEITSLEEFFIGEATPIVEAISERYDLHDICELPAGFVFGYQPDENEEFSTTNGLASVYWRGGDRRTTGATLRNGMIVHVFGVLLAHEVGHCFGLCHHGHDGAEHIMFTPADGGIACGVIDPDSGDDPNPPPLKNATFKTVLEFMFLGGEPRFTLKDGEDAWRWILEEAKECIGIEEESVNPNLDPVGNIIT